MGRKKKGEITKAVKKAFLECSSNRIVDREQLVVKLRHIIKVNRGSPEDIYQNVGMALDKWRKKYSDYDYNDIMRLADEADKRIRPAYEGWLKSMTV
jgi:intergrase/recombinase